MLTTNGECCRPRRHRHSQSLGSQFKDLMERSRASVSDFDHLFLSMTSSENTDQSLSTSDDSNDLLKVNDCDAECSEHVSDASGMGDEKLLSTDDKETKHQFSDKTLVFSGSGTRASQPLYKPPTRVSSEGGGSSSLCAFNMADRMMLLSDLERRIQTMGLADEHQVVNIDADCIALGREQISGNRNHRSQSNMNQLSGHTRNQPLFLGVSGSLLAELSNTIKGGGEDDSIEFTVNGCLGK